MKLLLLITISALFFTSCAKEIKNSWQNNLSDYDTNIIIDDDGFISRDDEGKIIWNNITHIDESSESNNSDEFGDDPRDNPLNF
jgi:hypothetical protein